MTKEIEELDLGRFEEKIDKSKLTFNEEDGTYDYDGDLYFGEMNLKSLLEIPIKFRNVSGDFDCNNNLLISLKGAPEKVGGAFWCTGNQLVSLKGAPLKIGSGFWCIGNLLLSKVHLSKIGGDLYFSINLFFVIIEGVIKVIKEMTIEQRINELKFFKKYDLKAYNMMIRILEENDLGYGPKAKEMLEIVNGYCMGNLI